MTDTKAQTCSTDGCGNAAAFRTRTKPTWCEPCMTDLLTQAVLTPLEPFSGKVADRRLMQCLECGTQAHYQFEYLLGFVRQGRVGCRACMLTDSARNWRGRHGYVPPLAPAQDIIDRLAAAHWVPTVPVDRALYPDDFVVARCTRCEHITVKSVRDVGFKCSCRQNVRAAHPTSRKASNLLCESEEELVKWWDHDVNDGVLWATTKVRGRKEVAWKCPECGHRFTATPVDMRFPRCEPCHEVWLVQYELYKSTPVADVPELAAAWDDHEDPHTVMVADFTQHRFKCLNGHHPRLSPNTYLRNGCPTCRAANTRANRKSLAEFQPELAKQWHPTRNGSTTPADLTWDSQRQVWWLSACCDHEWQESPRNRDKYDRLACPACEAILGSLASVDPGLAAEWSEANTDSPLHVRPHTSLDYTPEWVCANDPTHVWRSVLSTRQLGAGCPECRETGKSLVELAHHEAAVEEFGNARSGAKLALQNSASRESWTVDILVSVNGESVVIEYDGAYWHRAEAKMLVDDRKTQDLLADGYRVVRLREDDLAFLELEHTRLLQLQVHSSAARPHDVMAKVAAWLAVAAPVA